MGPHFLLFLLSFRAHQALYRVGHSGHDRRLDLGSRMVSANGNYGCFCQLVRQVLLFILSSVPGFKPGSCFVLIPFSLLSLFTCSEHVPVRTEAISWPLSRVLRPFLHP